MNSTHDPSGEAQRSPITESSVSPSPGGGLAAYRLREETEGHWTYFRIYSGPEDDPCIEHEWQEATVDTAAVEAAQLDAEEQLGALETAYALGREAAANPDTSKEQG